MNKPSLVSFAPITAGLLVLASSSRAGAQIADIPPPIGAAANPRAISILPIPVDLPSGSGGGNTPGPGGFDLNWYTIDGGGATFLTGGVFSLGGTAGQPDAGVMSGGDFELGGGFWYGVLSTDCYANCDNSTTAPVLNVLDFACFLNRFAAGDPYANCDGSTTPPVLNVLDFACFLNAFAAGCP